MWGLWGRRWVGGPWWVEGEVAQWFSGGGVDDSDEVLDQDREAVSVSVVVRPPPSEGLLTKFLGGRRSEFT